MRRNAATHEMGMSSVAVGSAPALRWTVVEAVPGCDAAGELARQASLLVAGGASPAAMLYATACPAQVEPAREALAHTLGPAASKVHVETVAGLAREILAASAAGTAPKGGPRPLLRFEEHYLNEDLKTLGIQTKRLREMLRFLHKGMSTLENREKGWLFTAEENQVVQAESTWLEECNAALPYELSGRAQATLASEGSVARTLPRFAHVFADNWTALSPASHALLETLATSSITVSGYEGDPGVPDEPHNDRHCLAKLLAVHPDADLVTLVPAAAPLVETPVWDFPASEFTGIARIVSDWLAEGVDPLDIAVVAPNRPWVHRLAQAMREANIPVATHDESPLRGDPRILERCSSQRAFALLVLAADASDPLGWRLWTGFGNWLLGSMAWKELRTWCAARALTPTEGLLALAGETGRAAKAFLGAEGLITTTRAGQAALDRLDGLAGTSLVRTACAACDADASELLDLLGEGLPDNASAQMVIGRLRTRALAPCFPEGVHAVRIGTPGLFVGHRVPRLVMCGLVDGFMPGPACFDARVPPDIQQRNLDEEWARFRRTAAQATRQLVLSRFDREWLFDAEPARMEVARIRADKKGRLALIRPSMFLSRQEETGWCG